MGMQIATINILEPCPLKCPSCYSRKSTKIMNKEQIKAIMCALPDSIGTVTFSGGEPFLLGLQLYDFVHEVNKKGIRPIIFTSGYIINEQVMSRMAEYIKSYHVTIKFPNTMDNYFKGRPDAFDNACAFIKYADILGTKVHIHHTVDKSNVRYMKEMLRFIEEHPVDQLHILRFLPFDEDDREISLDDAEWEEYCDKIIKRGKERVKIMYPSAHSYDQCHAGVTRVNILANGDITGCIYLGMGPIMGNIFRDSFENIQKKMFEWRASYGNDMRCQAKHYLKMI